MFQVRNNIFRFTYWYVQKQSSEVFFKKRFSLKFREIHRKENTCARVSFLKACNFIKKETPEFFSIKKRESEFSEISKSTFS